MTCDQVTQERSRPRPTISVILPTHNARPTIDRAIDSIVKQTYPRIEIIVIDDGSSDGTSEHIQAKYPDVRLMRQDNQGAYAARNRGITAATGEYIALIDADDEWLPTKAERQLQVLSERPGAVACACLVDVIRNGRVFPEGQEGGSEELTFRQMAHQRNYFMGPTLLVRRDVFLSAGQFDERFRIRGDLDFYMRLVGSGYCVVMLRERLYRYHIQTDSLGGGRTSILKNHRWISECIRKWDPASAECVASLLTKAEYCACLKRFCLSEAFAVGGYGDGTAAARLFREAAGLPSPDWDTNIAAILGKAMPLLLPRIRKTLADTLHIAQDRGKRRV